LFLFLSESNFSFLIQQKIKGRVLFFKDATDSQIIFLSFGLKSVNLWHLHFRRRKAIPFPNPIFQTVFSFRAAGCFTLSESNFSF